MSGNYPEEKKSVPKLNAKDATYRVYRRKWQKQLQAHKVRKEADDDKKATLNTIFEKWNRRAAVTTAHSEWINVKDRLPEEYKDVLCYYEYFRYGDFNCMFRTIDIGYYGNGIWGGVAGQGRKNKVLAWMPLPEPPKEES